MSARQTATVNGMETSGDGKLPVFVFPNTITFYLEDQTTHKQILTLCNPYNFAVRFRVLSTNSRKYTVVDPEGSIKSKCCIDIVVHYSSISPSNCQDTDKFCIQMYDFVTKQLIGRRDVTATLISGEPDRSTPDQDSETLAHVPPSNRHPRQQGNRVNQPNQPQYTGIPTWVVLLVLMFIPLEGQETSIAWKVYVNLKPVVSYVLDQEEVGRSDPGFQGGVLHAAHKPGKFQYPGYGECDGSGPGFVQLPPQPAPEDSQVVTVASATARCMPQPMSTPLQEATTVDPRPQDESHTGVLGTFLSMLRRANSVKKEIKQANPLIGLFL